MFDVAHDPDDVELLTSRDGWAVWQGVAYPCRAEPSLWPRLALRARGDGRAPTGLERSPDEDEPRHVHLVDPELLDAWFEAHWTFRWRGEPFASLGTRDGGRVWSRYEGTDQEFARRHLSHVHTGQALLPIDEITDVTVHRTDLLALRHERLRLLAEADGYAPRAFAVVDGRELPAGAEVDAAGQVTVVEGGDLRQVPVAELTAWWMVYWTFTIEYGDVAHPFAALRGDRDTVLGKYTGDATYGLVMHTYLLSEASYEDGRRYYTANAYPEKLTDLTEHRADLLADLLADG
ncbi:hypothetical protein ABH931_004008 [Streptacidiphilus sp. MAP12-33]|uniref:hypothetical protein n=1 Tax=Streptacidiphilus sp. MAP12-33 TaxID=3156266 RepID=UPI003516B903